MEKKRILVKDAKNGMLVAEDVYTSKDRLVIPAGTILTNKIIKKLNTCHIEEFIACIGSMDSKKQEDLRNQTRETEEFHEFQGVFEETVDSVKENLDYIVEQKGTINEKQLLGEVMSVLDKSRNGLHAIDMLNCMRNYDDLTYVHSVNVALISYVIGEWIDASEEELNVLAMAGLLHDIGKLKIPEKILKKPGPLTDEEYEVIKKHTIYGYSILKEQKIDSRVKAAALMHHERCDGTGYPAGILANDIPSTAKIVSIADVYDAMTCDRVYRPACCPFEVIDMLEKDGVSKYDQTFLYPFLHRVVNSYINDSVLLNNEKLGKIIMINRYSLSKPVVKVEDMYIDLSKHKDLKIKKIVT